MARKKSTGPRITVKASNFYRRHFHTENAGIQYILECIPALYAETISEVAGFFSQEELVCLVWRSQGPLVRPRFAGKVVISRFEAQNDSNDPMMIIAKLEALSAFQRYCFELLVNEFWIGPYEEKDIPGFLQIRGLA